MTLREINALIRTAAKTANPRGGVRFGPLDEMKGEKRLPLITVMYPELSMAQPFGDVRTDRYTFRSLVLVSDAANKPLDTAEAGNLPSRLMAIEEADALRDAFLTQLANVFDAVGFETGQVRAATTLMGLETLTGFEVTYTVIINRQPC